IANPKTTLAWLTTAVGAPGYVLGMLVPIRESGSMIPQLFIGGLIRQLAVRKWVWVLGSIVQGLCIVSLGFVAMRLEGKTAGWAILAIVIAFSLARGFCSISAKDVLGKTIPKKVRGQLNGWSASAAGLLTVAIGSVLILPGATLQGSHVIGWCLIGAGALWFFAAATYATVDEAAGETGGGRNVLEALAKLKLLANDKPFRRFVMTRALLMCSALSAPFYVAMAQSNIGSTISSLGAFVVASGLASLLSAPFWGRFADRSSKQVMIAGALITALTGIVTFMLEQTLPNATQTFWLLPSTYFILSIAHSGVRIGRKTYVVDLATGNQRTDYVAISNTVIGILLLVVGTVGLLVPVIGNSGVILLLATMGLAGAALGTSLPETET
ncbi:MAG: MFS transporter, partial [Woeseiaceae bacterium]